jgi:hypothetical protein
MKCPCCKSSLQTGQAGVARSTAGMIADAILSTGSSSHYLYFYPQGDADNPVCLDLSDRAYYCLNCRTLVVRGPRKDDADESTCLSCGKDIPPDKTRCPACGWSWGGEAGDT